MTVIDEFMTRFLHEFDYYQEVAKICAQQCEIGLGRSGIRSIVTSRAKRFDRLRDKLEKRNEKNPYASIDAIYGDVVDLAGIRIALYFPGDKDEVDKFINSQFHVLKKKEFPEKTPVGGRRFSGYWAVHYHVKLLEGNLIEVQERYAEAKIEIQVASVLMHAWAEVDHDLVYKPMSGALSEDEVAILDELNGLVLAGEIALERLQRAVHARVTQNRPFSNHYELAAYLLDGVKSLFQGGHEPVLGNVELLLRFLQIVRLDRPKSLQKYLTEFNEDTELRSIAIQVTDHILSNNLNFYEQYCQAQDEMRAKNPFKASLDEAPFQRPQYEAVGYFLLKWTTFERAVRELVKMKSPEKPTWGMGPVNVLRQLELFPTGVWYEIESIRRMRNDLVHGIHLPEENQLYRAGEFLEHVVGELLLKVPKRSRTRIEKNLMLVAERNPDTNGLESAR